MSKLRKRGDVGDSSEMSTAESFLAKPPPPPPPPSPSAATAAASPTTEDTESTAAEPAEAVPDGEDATDAGEDGPAKPEEEWMTTTGIGGVWREDANATKEAHKPKVGSWGVFERPADISKAFGGGRKIGVGGYVPSEEELAAKKAETEAKLAAYRKSVGADVELEKAHEEEIRAAAKEARQLMRYGAVKGALAELEKVREYVCVTTELGGETTLELGLALVANNQPEEAKAVFQRLMKNPDKRFKKLAQQMLYQEEAQSFLRVEEVGLEACMHPRPVPHVACPYDARSLDACTPPMTRASARHPPATLPPFSTADGGQRRVRQDRHEWAHSLAQRRWRPAVIRATPPSYLPSHLHSHLHSHLPSHLPLSPSRRPSSRLDLGLITPGSTARPQPLACRGRAMP